MPTITPEHLAEAYGDALRLLGGNQREALAVLVDAIMELLGEPEGGADAPAPGTPFNAN